MEMFYKSIRHQQAIFMFKIPTVLRRAFDGPFYERQIFRMNPLEDKFHGRRYG